MALTSCPDCQREVSTSAKACPGCGRPMAQGPLLGPRARRALVISAAAAVAIAGLVWAGVGARLDSRCTVNAFGAAACSFVNTGIGPGHTCVTVALTNDSNAPLVSEKICSGLVWPSGHSSVEIASAFDRSPVEHCANSRGAARLAGKSLSDLCQMSVDTVP